MIKNEETYCVVYHKIVREIGAIEAIVYSTIVSLLRRSDGIGEVSNQTLMDMCGINNKMSLNRYISKLIETGYLEKQEGKGRGNISIYYITEKGNKLLPFNEKKGNKNDTEKVTKMNEKGNNLLPINKGINKGIKGKEETPTPLSEKMEDFIFNFDRFWELYPGDPDWSYDKEACEKVWLLMCEEWRAKLIMQLERGLRWRKRENDKPIFYLRDYQGQDVHMELPFMRQGTAACTKWLQDAQKAGQKVCVMLMQSGDKTEAVFCLARDRETMEAGGAKYVRMFEPYCE